MSEKLAEVYEQYNMEILSSRKGRGAIILNTEDGLRILEPFRGNITRLEQEYILKNLLEKEGCENLDSILPNNNGQLLTCDRYRQPFVLKQYFEGEECNMNEPDDLVRAITALAKFHIVGAKIMDNFSEAWNEVLREKEQHRIEEIRQALENGEELERLSSLYEISEVALQKALDTGTEEENAGCLNEKLYQASPLKKERSVEELFERHNREMKKIYHFIMKVKRKNDFEKTYLKVYDTFYKQGVQCVKLLENDRWGSDPTSTSPLWGQTPPAGTALGSDPTPDSIPLGSDPHYGICHGSFNHHNVILGDKVDALVHFEKFAKGNQLNDLYQFARKAMEKNHFNYELLEIIFNTYDSYISLSPADYQYMYILFSYPEKFWKIANGYYNTNKSFLSPKYGEKLQVVIEQESEKQNLLQEIRLKNKLPI